MTTEASITLDQMKDAIFRSGYLLEQRVEAVLTEHGYYVETNPVFLDPETGKSREIDISAMSGIQLYPRKRSGLDFIFPVLLCECENNHQPLVFFTKDTPVSPSYHWDIKVSGIPVKFANDKNSYVVGLADFTGMDRYHHYCKGAVATQYCTYYKPKQKDSLWMAWHNEEQHDTFTSIIQSLDYEMSKHFDDWRPPQEGEEEQVSIQIYYPTLIIQGSMYSAILEEGNLILRKAKHVHFLKEHFVPHREEVETYHIDVLTEDYLPVYLKMLDSEIEQVKKTLKRKRGEVLLSIDKIVANVRGVNEIPKSYREYLEY